MNNNMLVKIIQNEDPIIVDIIRQNTIQNILEDLYSELIYCYLVNDKFGFKEYEQLEKKYINMGWISPR